MMSEVDNNCINEIIFEPESSRNTYWKFCNRVTLPKSEVVFFTQMLVVITLMIISILKLTAFEQRCEEASVWISILSSLVGYILPNPRL